jgi:hypothetical protein
MMTKVITTRPKASPNRAAIRAICPPISAASALARSMWALTSRFPDSNVAWNCSRRPGGLGGLGGFGGLGGRGGRGGRGGCGGVGGLVDGSSDGVDGPSDGVGGMSDGVDGSSAGGPAFWSLVGCCGSSRAGLRRQMDQVGCGR